MEFQKMLNTITLGDSYKLIKISLDRLNGILANGQISFDTDISKI